MVFRLDQQVRSVCCEIYKLYLQISLGVAIDLHFLADRLRLNQSINYSF